MAKSCITQMANQLRYAFPWVMHALKTAPPSHCTSPQTTPHIQVYSRAWLSFLKNVAMSVCTTSMQNVLASSAQRILMVNMDVAVADAFYSMNLTLSMCHLFCLPFVPKTVSQPSSSPNFLPNSIPLSNVGDMQSGFIVNSHLHQPLKMSSKMLERHSLLSLWNAFRSELTPSTPPCIALTVSTGSEIGLSVMRIVTGKVLMAVKLLGQAVASTVTVRFPLMQPRK